VNQFSLQERTVTRFEGYSFSGIATLLLRIDFLPFDMAVSSTILTVFLWYMLGFYDDMGLY
jgi:hypothetical protein